MPAISAQEVKKLRDQTGAGFADCKNALVEADGDFAAAVRILREKGAAAAEKRSGRTTGEGIVHSYIHDRRIGVMVELACETDFVARNEKFRELANDIAIHIACGYPAPARWVAREEVPEEVIRDETELIRVQLANDPKNARKPPAVLERIVGGKIEKFLSDRILMEQLYALDDSKKTSIQDLVLQTAQSTGENIRVRRFVKFERGADLG